MIHLKHLFWGALMCSCSLNALGATHSYASMEFVRLPAGTFTMGSLEARYGPVLVQLSAFSLSKTEVTQAQWKSVMGYNPTFHKGDNLPVANISWEEAMEFCKKLTERERKAGRLPRNLKFTLPTEAQWEYACRAGTRTRFSFGDSESLLSQYGNIYEGTPLERKGGITPVGTFRPNAWGFYDMYGNVCEWCLDYYHLDPLGGKDPIRTTPGETDPGSRTIRGGDFLISPKYCSAFRLPRSPSERSMRIGFRVAIVQSSNP